MPRKKEPGSPPNPLDPRLKFPNHQERGPERFVYTFKDIAKATGLKLSTVRVNHALRIREFSESRDLVGLTAFVAPRLRGAAVTAAELEIRYGAGAALRWENRWPRFGLFWCPVPGCQEWMLSETCCGVHGGCPPVVMDREAGYFMLRVEGSSGRVGYHRIMCGSDLPASLVVHHKDENKWNNRAGNLESLTVEEHTKVHGHFG